MSKKGFTLIELLAVIVILAIIALIATPIVLNIIKETNESSEKISIEMYGKALENAMVEYKLANPSSKFIFGFYTVIEGSLGKRILKENVVLDIDYDGNVVCDTITLNYDGTYYITDCKVNDKLIDYSYGNKRYYKDGDIVYFDVLTGKGCTSYHEDNSKSGYNGIYMGKNSTKRTNNQNSCLKFYAFLDDSEKKLKLLLDHNTTTYVEWHSSEFGPQDILSNLYNDTKDWIGTLTPENYEWKGYEWPPEDRPYTINYSEYKARLITANEIAKITGAADEKTLNWKEGINEGNYFFDGGKGNDSNWSSQIANSTNLSEYYWLFDRLRTCEPYGCKVEDDESYGYWTSSALSDHSSFAWYVTGKGQIYNNRDMGWTTGIRPSITILKSDV